MSAAWRKASADIAEFHHKRAKDCAAAGAAIDDMLARPEHYAPFNAPNGWGSMRTLVPALQRLLAAMEGAPGRGADGVAMGTSSCSRSRGRRSSRGRAGIRRDRPGRDRAADPSPATGARTATDSGRCGVSRVVRWPAMTTARSPCATRSTRGVRAWRWSPRTTTPRRWTASRWSRRCADCARSSPRWCSTRTPTDTRTRGAVGRRQPRGAAVRAVRAVRALPRVRRCPHRHRSAAVGRGHPSSHDEPMTAPCPTDCGCGALRYAPHAVAATLDAGPRGWTDAR